MLYIFLIMLFIFSILFYFKGVFISLIVGFIFIILVNRFIYIFDTFAKNQSKRSKLLIAAAVLSFLIIFLLYFLFVQANNAVDSIKELYSLISAYQETSGDLFNLVETTLLNEQLFGIDLTIFINVFQFFFMASNTLVSSLQSSVSSLSSILGTAVFTVPFMLLFYYTKKEELIHQVNCALPYDFRQPFWVMVSSLVSNLNIFVTSKLVEMLILFGLYAFGFYLSGAPYWIFFAFFLSIFSIIPYIGFIFGSVPVCILVYILGPESLLYVVVTIIIVQIIDIFILLPKMVSQSVHINPLAAVLISLMALHVFGIVGMIVAVPIYLIFKIVLTSCYNELVKIYPNKSIKST
ncbi:MAG: AI-2E family transporter [Methanosarcinaceae archaeon]|nr:AI-2E family transporter [Methanosarcinaceae archaeon]